MSKRTSLIAILAATAVTLMGAATVYAGSLTPPGTPAHTMYSLNDIYNKLTDFSTTTTAASGSLTTPATITSTFHSLSDIFGLLSAQNSNLVSGNIKAGVTIFGILGTHTSGFPHAAQPLKTDQTVCSDQTGTVIPCSGTGEDGEFQKGAARSYTDNGNGTVTDNSTGLVWQQQDDGSGRNWSDSLDLCNTNAAGLPGTGWRLPNAYELYTLLDFGVTSAPLINATYFPVTQSADYWSSTVSPVNSANALAVRFYTGAITNGSKGFSQEARCVRGG